MAKQLESLIAKGRRAKRPPEQKEGAFGLADLSTYCKFTAFEYKHFSNCISVADLLEKLVTKGGVKTLLILLTKSTDTDAQRFSALALANASSAGLHKLSI